MALRAVRLPLEQSIGVYDDETDKVYPFTPTSPDDRLRDVIRHMSQGYGGFLGHPAYQYEIEEFED